MTKVKSTSNSFSSFSQCQEMNKKKRENFSTHALQNLAQDTVSFSGGLTKAKKSALTTNNLDKMKKQFLSFIKV